LVKKAKLYNIVDSVCKISSAIVVVIHFCRMRREDIFAIILSIVNQLIVADSVDEKAPTVPFDQ